MICVCLPLNLESFYTKVNFDSLEKFCQLAKSPQKVKPSINLKQPEANKKLNEFLRERVMNFNDRVKETITHLSRKRKKLFNLFL